MATYFTSSSNQRDAVPMLCLREPLPNLYPEATIVPGNMALYMNSTNSYSEAMPGSSQQQNNCFVVPSIGDLHSTSEQQEIITNLGGFQTLQGQGLSLSLGTDVHSGIHMPPIHDQNHNSSFNSVLGTTNPSIPGNGAYRSDSIREECMRCSETFPHGLSECNPDLSRGDFSLHGMSGVGRTIPNSKYLKAAQQLLDEVVDIRKAIKRLDINSHSSHEDTKSKAMEDDGQLENERPSANGVPNSQGSANNSSCELSHAEKQDLHNKLTKLMSMLDEVESGYRQYYHQMQIVISSFDLIAGTGAAKPYTALALQTISRHFRNLHDAIAGQISATQNSLGEQDALGNKGVGISRLRFVDHPIRQQRALQQLGMTQHAWRPQRGLPETSVSILRAWLFEHFLHPYPKDSDKVTLARQTGLTKSQVSNWFINARVRLWKPMIEEMHKQEIGDADMDNSSSENASKVMKNDVKTSNDMGDDDLQHCQSSMANKKYCRGQVKDLRSDQVLDTEIMASTGMTGLASVQSGGHQSGEQRPNFDDCGLFPDDTVVQSGGAIDRFMAATPSCQMSELGRYESGSGVSLTLGLHHCEGGNYLPGDVYNAPAASPIGAELESISNGSQQQRFSSPQLSHDFVV